VIRTAGGLLYFAGSIFMVWNIWMTIAGKLRDEAPMATAAFDPAKDRPVVQAAPPAPAPTPLPLAAE
jgi:cytochrome c oxidase cbb3-type subunit 1